MDELETFVVENLSTILEIPSKKIKKDTDLLQLGIDSMNFIRLIVEIEEKYEIEIPEEDFELDNFRILSNILEVIHKNLSGNGGKIVQ